MSHSKSKIAFYALFTALQSATKVSGAALLWDTLQHGMFNTKHSNDEGISPQMIFVMTLAALCEPLMVITVLYYYRKARQQREEERARLNAGGHQPLAYDRAYNDRVDQSECVIACKKCLAALWHGIKYFFEFLIAGGIAGILTFAGAALVFALLRLNLAVNLILSTLLGVAKAPYEYVFNSSASSTSDTRPANLSTLQKAKALGLAVTILFCLTGIFDLAMTSALSNAGATISPFVDILLLSICAAAALYEARVAYLGAINSHAEPDEADSDISGLAKGVTIFAAIVNEGLAAGVGCFSLAMKLFLKTPNAEPTLTARMFSGFLAVGALSVMTRNFYNLSLGPIGRAVDNAVEYMYAVRRAIRERVNPLQFQTTRTGDYGAIALRLDTI